MKFDYTPILHAAIAVFLQLSVFVAIGNPWIGGLLACTWWVAREHTQAEYKWIERYGSGKRGNMPWWGGFDYRVWDTGSVLDWVVPVVACVITYLLII